MNPAEFLRKVLKGSRQPKISVLLPSEEFRAIIRHECARCDRNDGEFSLILLELDNLNGSGGKIHRTVRDLVRRIRTTDELGWFDERSLGVLLPDTPAKGADLFATETLAGLPYSVFTYPHHMPFEGDNGPEWHNDQTSEGKGDISHPEHYNTTPFDTDLKTFINHRTTNDSVEEILFGQRLPLWKRSMDIGGSILGLIILSPLFALVALYIKILSPGPVFFRQERVGYFGQTFTMWKFRTMRIDADTSIHKDHLKKLMASDVSMNKLDEGKDSRLIPMAGLIRKSCLDELPQLINVLKGDMSLIGPRPCLPYEARDYRQWQRQRFHALPGMTGLWQVSGKNRTTFKEMMRLDIRYSRNNSFWSDWSIFLKTAPAITGQLMGAAKKRIGEDENMQSLKRSPSPKRFLDNLVRQLFL